MSKIDLVLGKARILSKGGHRLMSFRFENESTKKKLTKKSNGGFLIFCLLFFASFAHELERAASIDWGDADRAAACWLLDGPHDSDSILLG